LSPFLDAASALDAQRAARTSGRRALIATLAFAGRRSAEVVGLQWRDVNLASGRIYVGRSKTDAGMREVDMLPVLRDELLAYKASASALDSTTTSSLPQPAASATRTTSRGG
jgi:integrase